MWNNMRFMAGKPPEIVLDNEQNHKAEPFWTPNNAGPAAAKAGRAVISKRGSSLSARASSTRVNARPAGVSKYLTTLVVLLKLNWYRTLALAASLSDTPSLLPSRFHRPQWIGTASSSKKLRTTNRRPPARPRQSKSPSILPKARGLRSLEVDRLRASSSWLAAAPDQRNSATYRAVFPESGTWARARARRVARSRKACNPRAQLLFCPRLSKLHCCARTDPGAPCASRLLKVFGVFLKRTTTHKPSRRSPNSTPDKAPSRADLPADLRLQQRARDLDAARSFLGPRSSEWIDLLSTSTRNQ